MKINLMLKAIALVSCLAIEKPVLANPTDQPLTIRVFIDLRLPKQAINDVMGTILRSAVERGFNPRVRAFDPVMAGEWEPPQPLDLRDFRPSMASLVFQGRNERERDDERLKRLRAASSSFDSYMGGRAVGTRSCSGLFDVAREIANESFGLTILVLGDPICSSPQVNLRLPPDRNLITMLVPAGDRDRDRTRDCALFTEERHIRASFPYSTIIPPVGSDTLSDVLLNPSSRAVSTELQVHGCTHAPAASGDLLSPNKSKHPPIADGPIVHDSGLRIIIPKHRAHVGRSVPFQGDGAHPGETIVPVTRVGDEYWPQVIVHAAADGSYGGEVIIGRPFNDCGITYELRVFGNVLHPVSVGRPLGSWPEASDASLPVELTRTDECAAAGD